MTEIDHIEHGWAMLALRNPEIRVLSERRRSIREMCECYSIAVLHLRALKKAGSDLDGINEYEELVAGIEEEVRYYFKNQLSLPAHRYK